MKCIGKTWMLQEEQANRVFNWDNAIFNPIMANIIVSSAQVCEHWVRTKPKLPGAVGSATISLAKLRGPPESLTIRWMKFFLAECF